MGVTSSVDGEGRDRCAHFRGGDAAVAGRGRGVTVARYREGCERYVIYGYIATGA